MRCRLFVSLSNTSIITGRRSTELYVHQNGDEYLPRLIGGAHRYQVFIGLQTARMRNKHLSHHVSKTPDMHNKSYRFIILDVNYQVSVFFMNIRLRFFLPLFFLVLVVPSLYGQVSLVKDINTKADSLFSGYPEFITAINGKVVYAADDYSSGRELWISDGTKAGTKILKDINPSGDSNPVNPEFFNGIIPVSEADLGFVAFEFRSHKATAFAVSLIGTFPRFSGSKRE